MRLFAKLLPALLLACTMAPALAHLVPSGQGSVRVVGDTAYVLVSLPVSTLSGFDDNADGLMSLAELNAHRDDMLRQAAASLELRDGDAAGKLIFQDLLIPHLHDPASKPVTSELIAMQRYQFAQPVRSLSLRTHLFAPGEKAGSTKGTLLVGVVQDGRSEAVILSAGYAGHRFFAGPLPTVWRFMQTGIEHILLGFDHLLFLLTILVAGAGWRYWAAVCTSFTVAHSITLTLAATGWVSVPSSIAEPLIAASIVLMALDNLRTRHAALRWRAGLVFVCGLIHGVGFAAALGQLGGTADLWLALLGFNLGVEAGQLMFVTAALLLIASLSRVWPAASGKRAVQAASVAAAGLGTALLVNLLAS